jgi:hypothetical protein
MRYIIEKNTLDSGTVKVDSSICVPLINKSKESAGAAGTAYSRIHNIIINQ